MTRTLTALAAVTLAFALAGCSSPANTTGDTTGNATGSEPTADSPAPAGGGDVDCTALEGDDAAAFGVGIQLLAQLRTQSVVDSVKDGVIVYDPDAVERVLTKLKTLEGHGVLGDPIPDVEFYLEANAKGRDILANEGPVPQASFDDLIAFEGDAGAFITRQISITAAYGEACD
jgi:hypothetical protein